VVGPHTRAWARSIQAPPWRHLLESYRIRLTQAAPSGSRLARGFARDASGSRARTGDRADGELPLLGSNQDSPDPERRLACEAMSYETSPVTGAVSHSCRTSGLGMSELV